MAIEKVNVLVADNYLNRFSKVVEGAEQAGLEVEQALDTIGVVSGSIDSSKLRQLEEVEGVASVERQREVRIPEPDSEFR